MDGYSSKDWSVMDLFSVVVHKNSPRPFNFYGSIRFSAFTTTQSIYTREREDSEWIPSCSKSFLLLFDGPPLLTFCECFTIYIDLKHKVQDNDASLDEELCVRDIVRENQDPYVEFDELLNFRVEGKECSVEVGLGFYEKAVRAHVTATLINLKKKDIKVYGQITSKTSFILNASKDLFNKKPKGGILVHEHDDGVELQLSSSVVAAPLDSELTVSANIYGYNDDNDKVCELLVSGTAKFDVKEFGMSVELISGIHGDIKVEVGWLYI